MMQENEIKDSNENIIYNLKTRKKFFSKLTEEETNIFLKNLNLDENILNELENIVKNGQDLISIYNNNQLLEKINLDLHSKNIINSAIEEALEEQLKINIEIENNKNIILNIENEPKYELKEIYAYLELLLKKKVFLCPKNSPKEILNPNTFIYKKIILNPDKYCNLSIFDEYFLTKNNEEKNNLNNNINNKNDMNININMNKTPDLNVEKKEIINKGGYNSLFQMKKKNPISDFTIEYQMPNFNKSNDININNNKDFKYQNILSNKDKEKDINNKLNINLENNNNNLNINNNLNNNKEQQKIKFNNAFNIINNTDSNINKNYFTQRNFAPKNFSQTQNELNDNGEIFSKITDFKIIDRTKNANNNNYIEKEKENNLENINNKNKTENRYEYVKYQELDIFKNKNMYNNNPKPPQEMQQKPVNDINNLILKTQTTNIPPMKNKIDDSDDILKSLREKYSLQNNNNVEEKRDYKDSKMDFTNDYKPKTPIAEGRRTFNNDSMKFNFMDENSNDPLENKFLNINRQNKKEDFDKYNFLNKNINNPFNNKEIDEQNKGYMNIGKMRTNRPSPGLDFNNFQYKTTDYKNSFGQNMEGNEGGDELIEEN